MRKFIGLLFHMGIVQLPTIEHYWNTTIYYGLPLCRAVMSRNRFQMLLRMWHFADNDTFADNKLQKIMPISSYFNMVMRNIYYPNKHLCIDESVMLWRGRLFFRVYIKNKRHRYGIKLYELCESGGLILKFEIYQGAGDSDDTVSDLGVTGLIVKNLMQRYLDKGKNIYIRLHHHIFILFRFVSKFKQEVHFYTSRRQSSMFHRGRADAH